MLTVAKNSRKILIKSRRGKQKYLKEEYHPEDCQHPYSLSHQGVGRHLDTQTFKNHPSEHPNLLWDISKILAKTLTRNPVFDHLFFIERPQGAT